MRIFLLMYLVLRTSEWHYVIKKKTLVECKHFCWQRLWSILLNDFKLTYELCTLIFLILSYHAENVNTWLGR